jgi:hypothetical protein
MAHYVTQIPQVGDAYNVYPGKISTCLTELDNQLYTTTTAASSNTSFRQGYATVGAAVTALAPTQNKIESIYTPTSPFYLTGSYVTIPGSSHSFTPVSPSSTITYKFSFHIVGLGTGSFSFAHFRLYNSASQVLDSWTWGMPTVCEQKIHYEMKIPSWSGARTLYLQTRYFVSTATCKIHQVAYLDGAASTAYVKAPLEISES